MDVLISVIGGHKTARLIIDNVVFSYGFEERGRRLNWADKN